VGLLFFAGFMQRYVQYMTLRLEDMRVKRRDIEDWMKYRRLPHELVEHVRCFHQYKWVATLGVNEEKLMQNLPMYLRRDIKRHLCLDLVQNVPFFNQMDDNLLNVLCEQLKPTFYTKDMYITFDGDPMYEMLFIINGELENVTTNRRHTSSFNIGILKPGDFYGEELLTWAVDPMLKNNPPTSTHTIRTLKEVLFTSVAHMGNMLNPSYMATLL